MLITEEIRAAAIARAAPAQAEVDHLRAAEAAAIEEDRAATRELIRAEKQKKAAYYSLIAARGDLSAARDRAAAHGALIEMLDTDPTLIDDLHRLSFEGGAHPPVTPERMSALGCRGLIDRRYKPSSSVFSALTPLTVAGWATLHLYREITGQPVDQVAPSTTPTEDH